MEIKDIVSKVDILDVVERHVHMKPSGHEHVGLCPFHDDDKPSLKVNRQKQIFKCFVCGAGGDAYEFVRLLNPSLKRDEILADITGVQNFDANNPTILEGRPKKEKTVPPALLIPPAPAPENRIKNRFKLDRSTGEYVSLGTYENHWEYHTAAGDLWFYVVRFKIELEDGTFKKDVIPLTYRAFPDTEKWTWMGPPTPRPLYNLNKLKANPTKPVLVVEGEKTADAAEKLYLDYVVISWMGGVDGVHSADWSALNGRDVLLWPDNDTEHKYKEGHEKEGQLKPFHEQPGNKAMYEILEKVSHIVSSVKWVHNTPDLPHKWDVADANWSIVEANSYLEANIINIPPRGEVEQTIDSTSVEIPETSKVGDCIPEIDSELLGFLNYSKFIGKKLNKRNNDEKFKEKLKNAFEFFGVKVCKSVTFVTETGGQKISTNPDFPIFKIDWKENGYLIVMPMHSKKAERIKLFNIDSKHVLIGQPELIEAYAESKSNSEDEEDSEKKKDPRIENAAVCFDFLDWVNLLFATFGDHKPGEIFPIFSINNGSKFSEFQFNEISRYAQKVHQIPSLEYFSAKAAHERGLNNLYLHTLKLPDYLQTKVLADGKPCKTLFHYFHHFSSYDFHRLFFAESLPYAFWQKKEGKGGITYNLKEKRFKRFLKGCGYGIYCDKSSDDFKHVFVDGNVVTEITNKKTIRDFVTEFLDNQHLPEDLCDRITAGSLFTDATLDRLHPMMLDFKNNDPDTQYYIFNNGPVAINKNGISLKPIGSISKHVWDTEIIEHYFKILEPFFKIKFDENLNEYKLESYRNSNPFVCYLINTCRMYWAKEEAAVKMLPPDEQDRYWEQNKFKLTSPFLSESENMEQELHFINRCFAIGYLLTRRKRRDQPWAVIASDYKLNEEGAAIGGSGKSITFNYALQTLLKRTFEIPGKKSDATKQEFLWDGMNRFTSYVYVDDAHKYFDFEYFFDFLTSNVTVNRKNKSQFRMLFEDSPKMAICTNYTIDQKGPSFSRRMLNTVFSDYYHEADDLKRYFKDSRTPKTEFGKQLIVDFTIEEMNEFYNFMLNCVHFYFNAPVKVDPPMENLQYKMLIQRMKEPFFRWAETYFADISGNTNKLIRRDLMIDDFLRTSNEKPQLWTRQFKESMIYYCSLKGWDLNPEREDLRYTVDKKTGNKRILKNEIVAGERKTLEYYFIDTSKVDKLSDEEKRTIAQNIASWDKDNGLNNPKEEPYSEQAPY